MNNLALRVDGLSKQYTIIEGRRRHNTLRDYLAHGVKSVWRRDSSIARKQTFWALHDVSFEVREGEVVGLIGRNGAGKSTLLKILSRITEPTAGFAEISGRVGSLLEVGTGFHGELTGQENIYLNGAILGMRKHEIDRKRDDIVAFAEVEKFIDAPVKHYSSGMYMRLAFAVAAHLHPDILLVDEVLAVGDAEFQKKCLGRMGDAAREGRTVIFVSHNMGAITQLCDRALWIDGGHIKLDGAAATVVSSYLSSSTTGRSEWWNPSLDQADGAAVQFESVRVLKEHQPTTVIEYPQPFQCEIVYRVKRPQKDLSIICAIKDSLGTQLWASWDSDQTDWGNGDVKAVGRYSAVCKIPPRLLRPGLYYVTIQARYAKKNSSPDTWRPVASQENVVVFEISEVNYNLPGRSGVLTPMLEWDVERIGDEVDTLSPREA